MTVSPASQPPASLPPLLLRPHYVPKPWGGRRLEAELGREDLPAGPIGESWEAFDLLDDAHPAGCSRIEGGPHDGERLRDVLGAPFPLLLKVLDAREDLSVQVHPDGRAGARAGGGPVKEEAWIALADGGAVARADAADPRPLSAVLPGGWLARLQTIRLRTSATPTPGPTVLHIPGGTVHAILAGALLLEVQNPTDITWRLDDYDRPGLDGLPRALHLDEAAGQLTRPTPVAAELEPADARGVRRLRGERFEIQLHPAGAATALPAGALYFTRPGRVWTAAGRERAVPAHRTVVLAAGGASADSSGLLIAFAS